MNLLEIEIRSDDKLMKSLCGQLTCVMFSVQLAHVSTGCSSHSQGIVLSCLQRIFIVLSTATGTENDVTTLGLMPVVSSLLLIVAYSLGSGYCN